MLGSKNVCQNIFFVFVLFSVFSCSTFRNSSYSKENEVHQKFYSAFFNDSLQFHIDLLGGHAVNLKSNFIKSIPAEVYLSVRTRLVQKKNPLVFYSRSKSEYFGFHYFGILLNKEKAIRKLEKEAFKKCYSIDNSVYYQGSTSRVDNFWVAEHLIPLEKYWLQLIALRKSHDNSNSESNYDSIILLTNLNNEMSSLKTNQHYLSYTQENFTAFDSLNSIIQSKLYLTPIEQLHSIDTNLVRTGRLGSLYYQYGATLYSFVMNMEQVKYYNRKNQELGMKNPEAISQIEVSNLKDSDRAIPFILNQADSERIVMFNESHYDWRNRYLINVLLDSLYLKGYRYLCLEDLNPSIESSNKDFPSQEMGFYIKEPQMAALVRKALKLGYKIISYEDTSQASDKRFSSPIDQREYNQAMNLYRAFKKDSTQKWIVLAGQSHINKNGFYLGQKSMLQYFAEISSTTPLSINQTDYSDLFYHRNIFKDLPPDFYIVRSSQGYMSVKGGSDIYITTNMVSYPYFYTSIYNTNDVEYRVPESVQTKLRDDNNLYLFIYISREFEILNGNAIPVLILQPAHASISHPIYLQSNDYLVVLKDESDKILFKVPLVSK